MANGYTFFWKSFQRIPGEFPVSGLPFVPNCFRPESPVAISERLMTLRIPLAKHQYATFISTYAPTLLSDDETKDHYYAMLWSTLMQVPRRDKLIVLGDFNARIGSDSTIWGNVMVKHGVGNINCNGNRLLCLCSEFGLFVTNTLFQLKHKHKTTWMHPHIDALASVRLRSCQSSRPPRRSDHQSDAWRWVLDWSPSHPHFAPHTHSSPSPKTETSTSTSLVGCRPTIYSYFDFGLKHSSFRLPYQRPSSFADCARELFNGSNGSASLVDCTWKKFFVGGCGLFVTDVISEVVFGSFWLMLPGLGPNH